jgi:hypothetical protein
MRTSANMSNIGKGMMQVIAAFDEFMNTASSNASNARTENYERNYQE